MAGWEKMAGSSLGDIWRYTTTNCTHFDIYKDEYNWNIVCHELSIADTLQADTFGAAKDAAIEYVRREALATAAVRIELAIELNEC